MFTAKGLVAAGFNNEGNTGMRGVQLALLLDGIAYTATTNTTFALDKKSATAGGEGAVRKSR